LVLLLIAAILRETPGANAQDALVVQSCGTLPKAYSPGSNRQVTVDINGNTCVPPVSVSVATPTVTVATPLVVQIQPTPVIVSIIATQPLNVSPIASPQSVIIVGGGTSATIATPLVVAVTATTPLAVTVTPSISVTASVATPLAVATIGTQLSVNVANAIATGQATMANSSPVVIASNQSVGDPCMFQAKVSTPISASTATTLLVPASGSTRIYVCELAIIVAGADAVSLIEGTATGGNAKAVMGSTSAGSGMSLPANGGLTLGSGVGVVAQTASASSNLFLLLSAVATAAGNLTYVQQ
jgi:hypothetical protein